MKMQSSKHLLGTVSVLAMLASSAATPANAAASNGLYFGGSTLASEAFRQIFNCYTGATVGTSPWTDGFQFNSSVAPGNLPTTCTVTSTVQGMYAGVGSGNGVRGFIANDPKQWYGGTITPPATFTLTNTTSTSVQPPFPAVQPPFADTLNTTFNTYPYPRVDVGLSDSPLASTLASLTTTSITFTLTPTTGTQGWLSFPVTVTASGNTTASYTTTVYGQPIQIPAFEVNVAIPVNTNTLTVNSSITGAGTLPATQANQGAAIQLTTGQLCAIFSGYVTDWNSATTIPALDSTGAQISPRPAFYAANVGKGVGTAAQYSTTSVPINLVYRSDGSGTSFIIQNYLKAVCPLLAASDDATTTKYHSIFDNLTPSTSFSALITQIVAARGNGVWNTTTTTGARWIGASGSGGVASNISDSAANAGRIGYVSADFTRPYTTTVSGVGAPYSAALQNENLRANSIYLPNTVSTNALTFIAPTPAAADAAWNDTRLQAPQTTWTWNDYNIYNNTFTTTVTQGGVALFGQSVLPLTNRLNAYPVSGTTFLDLYSCYNVQTDAGRQTNLVTFLSWYMNGPALAQSVVQNAGFHLLPTTYSSNILTQYLTSGQSGYITAAARTQSGGCLNVASGAAGGAK